MDDDAGDGGKRWRARKPIDGDEAKAMKGEMRLEDFDAPAPCRIPVRLGRLPQIVRVEVARLVQHFGVAEGDHRASGSLHAEPHPADHVLSKVKHRLAGGGAEPGNWPNFLDAPPRW